MQDLISRQAAIDAINSHFGFNIEEEYGSAVQEVINGLPSAQPDLSSYSDKLWHNAYDRGRKEAMEEIIHCRECKYHIDGFFCQKANHHTSDKDCCASVFGAERRKT